MRTIFFTIRPLFAVLFSSVLVAACGGSGSSAPPPTGGLQLDPGDGQITVRWVADPGVEYWLAYWPGTTVSTESNTAHVWAGSYRGVSSPFVQTGLYNGTNYAFSINGRTNGGPGGPGTPSVYDSPRPGGATWKAGSAMGTSTMRAVAYGTAADATIDYVAVGDAGAIYKGTDGTNWTAVTTGPASSSINFRAATYSFTRFIAAGTGGQIFYSPDMATWTAATLSTPTANNFNALATNGALTVAVGDAGTIRYSTDGLTWTAPATVPTTNNLNGVTYTVSGLWMAVGANGTVLTSADGNTWAAQTSITPAITANLNAVAAQYSALTASYTYVAVGTGGTVIRSNDGVTWTSATISPAVDLSAVVVPPTNTQFVAVGLAGAALTSPDGITWTTRTPSVAPSTCAAANWLGMITAQVQFVAVGNGGANCNSH